MDLLPLGSPVSFTVTVILYLVSDRSTSDIDEQDRLAAEQKKKINSA
jgi:hypothetical protein